MSLRHLFASNDLDELEARRVRGDESLDFAAVVDRHTELWIESSARWVLRREESEHGALVEFLDESEDDPFEHLGGEPGGWTYLCASILRRDLDELGARGSHVRWAKHRLIAALDVDHPDLPEDLRASVVEDNTRVTVRFYTLQGDALFEHEDRYRAIGFEATQQQRLVLKGLCLSSPTDE